MPEYPPPSYGSFLIFPPIVAGRDGGNANGGREWLTTHLENDNRDVFNARRDESVWRFSLSGLMLHPKQIDEWDAFVDAAEGMANPVLFYLKSARFVITDELIGTGNGVLTSFQLQKSRSYQGKPPKIETIRFPWHNYPAQQIPGGAIVWPTEYVRIKVGSTPQTATEIPWLSGWDVSRETGLITFDDPVADGANVYASCKFLIKVHMQDWMPVESAGGGSYKFTSGATLFQPKGEGE